MIEFTKDPQNTIPSSLVKIIGLGGAGANMLDRVALDGMEGAEMLALNADIRTLSGSVASERIQLGRNLTKGLGTGGDPDLGQKVMMEAEKEVRSAIKGRKIIFLCVGLGGGTGSGGAPTLTRIAREEGAFVVVFATMPSASKATAAASRQKLRSMNSPFSAMPLSFSITTAWANSSSPSKASTRHSPQAIA